MRKNSIPPHVGIKGRINEKFPPLNEVNVRINRTLVPFQARSRSDGKRRVLLNNFNATVSHAQASPKCFAHYLRHFRVVIQVSS